MSTVLYLDFTDPSSYLAYRTVTEKPEFGTVDFLPFEATPPPNPIRSTTDAEWLDRLDRCGTDLPLRDFRGAEPALLPWTQKAHELVLLGEESGHASSLRTALFQAFFVDGIDLGRVDRLVEIAVGTGIDRTEAKAVLDVDRFTGSVEALRAEAEASGIRSPGTLVREGLRFEPPYDLGELTDFLSGRETITF